MQSAAWPRSLAIGMLSLGLGVPGVVAVSVMTAEQAWADCTGPSGIIVTCSDPSPAGYDEPPVNDDRDVIIDPNATVGNSGGNPAAINLNLTGDNDIRVWVGNNATVSGAGPGAGARHGFQLLTNGGDVTVTMGAGSSVAGAGTGGDGFRIRTADEGKIVMNLSGAGVTTTATANDNGEAIDAQTTGVGDVTINLYAGTYSSVNSDVIVAGSAGGGTVAITVAEGVTVTGGAGTGPGDDGILVTNAGIATINVHGTVSGVGGSGISVMNELGLADVIVNITNTALTSLIGGESGIEIGTDNAVETATITNSGLIEGNGVANAVIWANTTGNTLTIHNNGDGLIQATGAATDALIVETIGTGATTINNDATMIGRLALGGGDNDNPNVINNTSYETWTFTGVSEHGGGNADEVNNTGRYNLFDPLDDVLPGTGSVATFAGVEIFNNGEAAGLLSLAGYINQIDGSTNDLGIIQPTVGATLAFHGAAGFSFFEQDVDLGDDMQSEADRMIIRGNVTGATGLIVEDLNTFPGGGYNPVGITVVQVEGMTDLGDFYLEDGPIQKGLWTYDLFLNAGNSSAPVGDGTSKNCVDELDAATTDNCWVIASYAGSGWDLPQTLSIAQGMWHATADSWIDRASDLRTIHASTGGSGADASYRPSVPAKQHHNSGIWARGIGQIALRDVSYETEMFNQIVTVDADYREHLWAAQGGIDHSFEGNHGTTVIGILGGYARNEVDFTDAGDTASIQAPHVGAYLNWLNGPAYVDALVKGDFLNVDFDIAGDQVSTKGYNVGGRIEAGYRHQGRGHGFIEPVGSLTFVQTHLDEVTVAGTDVVFNDAQSLRGKLGGRAGVSLQNGEAMFDPYVHAYVGGEFLGKNSVFFDSGTGLELTADVAGVFGEVGGGFNLMHADRYGSLYAQGNYIFAEGYQAGNVKAGARVNW